MNTVFIGGSRRVSRLPAEVKRRLDNVISGGHAVIVGDANGADRAVQKYFSDVGYECVTVFCSGDNFRNNLGRWTTHHVQTTKGERGFQFYAAKDRAMAREADSGLMIWDGRSPGTLLNVLRLLRGEKIAVLFDVSEMETRNFKTLSDWNQFISHCNMQLRNDVRKRATHQEWTPAGTAQASLSGI